MRWVIIVVIAIALGFGWTQLVDIYPDNYVKIYVGKTLVEMSFAAFVLLLFFLMGALYIGFALVGYFLRAGSLFSRWRKRRGHHKASQSLGNGYLWLIKGDWRRAEKSLISSTDNSSVPYVNYLAAAQAAQEQSQFARRDDYLQAAYKAAPDERLAIGLAKARLHHMAGQHDLAEATLDDIENQGHKNSQFVAMRIQNFQATQNWSKVHDLLPLARKVDALPEEVLQQIDTQAHRALLVNSPDRQITWKELPKEQKQHADNILTYAQDMLRQGNTSGAEKLVRNALKSQYDDGLVNFYGKLAADKPAKLRRNVEGWLMARPESAQLNLAAGRLAASESNVELATGYFEKAIELEQLPGAYAALGELLEANSESGRALQLYRAGLARVSSSVEGSVALSTITSSTKEDRATNELDTAKEGELL